MKDSVSLNFCSWHLPLDCGFRLRDAQSHSHQALTTLFFCSFVTSLPVAAAACITTQCFSKDSHALRTAAENRHPLFTHSLSSVTHSDEWHFMYKHLSNCQLRFLPKMDILQCTLHSVTPLIILFCFYKLTANQPQNDQTGVYQFVDACWPVDGRLSKHIVCSDSRLKAVGNLLPSTCYAVATCTGNYYGAKNLHRASHTSSFELINRTFENFLLRDWTNYCCYVT